MASPPSPRALPSVDRLLRADGMAPLLAAHARPAVVAAARTVLAEVRAELAGGAAVAVDPPALVARTAARLAALRQPSLRPVVNATGTILHTNLGRAALAAPAVEALLAAARGPVTLEYDVATGVRGHRDDHVAMHLTALTGAEAATVVNNNAAALLLVLNTLAEGREVVVSRGELIEIGGSFRLPDILAKSGARLREVGTTNRTHPADYAAAIGPTTGALLKVHTSNYRIAGFTASVDLGALAALGHEHDVPVVEDLGSGALVDLGAHGLPPEPVVSARVAAGADLVTFSGDKLLGGPQAGLIVGRADLVEQVRANPLMRALRCDKLTLAALDATLRLYRTAPDLAAALPTLRALTRPVAELAAVGRRAAARLRRALGPEYRVAVVDSEAEVGSGAQPTEALPSKAVAIRHRRRSAHALVAEFRTAATPIIGRVRDDTLLLDLRLIDDPEQLVPIRE